MQILFILTFILTFSCTKVDPTPELQDEIYKDLLVELDVATKELEAEEKNLEKLVVDKEKAAPQSGQIKFANKKVFESENRIAALRQQKQYFEIKVEQRKNIDRNNYLDSIKNGKSWPNKQEVEEYKTTIKLQRDKINWDKNKGNKKDVPRGTNTEQKTEASGH